MLLSRRLNLCKEVGVFRLPYTEFVKSYVSVPDIVFGDDDEVLNEMMKKSGKNPFVAKKIKGRYICPWSKDTNKKLRDVIKLGLSKKRPKLELSPSYSREEMLRPKEVNRTKLRDTTSPHITWFGHASCYYQVDGVYFLTDPVWSSRASPFSFLGPKRYYNPTLELEDLKIDVVVLSHTHYDHLDISSARRIGNKAHWVVPLGVKSILASIGVTNCTELDWWSTYHYLSPSGKNFEITFTPTKHWTARGFFDRNTCLWGSYVIKGPKSRFFFSGDTAYCNVFKTIGDNFGPFDLSAIAIGAYSPRWFMKDVHCNPEESVKIHFDLKSKQSMAIHWGTFPLTDEDPIEPPLELARIRDMHNLPMEAFFSIAQGETLLIGNKPESDLATLYNDLYGSYLEQLKTNPELL